ncbi:hypothetical protein F4818DRAFT_406453 [Hypoxylon cercidicola]|nr:hypothetical protein F4818DRAFT_406453 [Hypoxylon cercidicola]
MASSQSDDVSEWRPSWYDVTLEDVLPYRGFVFEENYKIFKKEQHWVLVKMALQTVAPGLEEPKVDAALASLMKDATQIADEYRKAHPYEIFVEADQISSVPINAVFEAARQQSNWAIDVPHGLIPPLLHKLIHARHLYNQFTRFRGTPKRDLKKKTGQFAAAIDEWLREKPVEKPEEKWTRTSAKSIKYMMDRMIQGKGADWDSFHNDPSDDEDGTTAAEDGANSDANANGADLADSTVSRKEAQTITKAPGPDKEPAEGQQGLEG